jgi:hypothetical protein
MLRREVRKATPRPANYGERRLPQQEPLSQVQICDHGDAAGGSERSKINDLAGERI